MTDLDQEPDDATPLTPAEREGLIPSHITFRHELNDVEQAAILTANTWAFSRKHNPFTESFLKGLHRRMFKDVWRWAGKYRTTPRNFGVDTWKIQTEIHHVLNDAAYWIGHDSFTTDEIAVRFHHRLVVVHPFPNGNGRWSRLAGDIAAVRLGQPRFSWANSALRGQDATRQAYLAALRAADGHDLGPLVAFARS